MNARTSEGINIQEALENAQEAQAESTQNLTEAGRKTGQGDNPEVAREMAKPYQEIMAKIGGQEVLIGLTEVLTEQAPATQKTETVSVSSDVVQNPTEAVSEKSTAEILINSLKALDLTIKVEGVGEIHLDPTIEKELLTSVVESNLEGKSTADFLDQQFDKPDSPQSKLLIKGYEKVLQNLESTQAEKILIQKLIETETQFEQYKTLNNTHLQNVIARRFQITNENNQIQVVDRTDPDNTVLTGAEANQALLSFLETNIDRNTNSSDADLLQKIQTLDEAQLKGMEAVKKQIEEAKNYNENTENKMTFGSLLRSIAEWFSAITSGDFDKLNALSKDLKLNSLESKENKFEFSYDAKDDTPKKEELFAYLKGKELTLNQGTEQEQKVKIINKDQLQNIKTENGKISLEINPVKTEISAESFQKLDLNTIEGETGKQKTTQINQSADGRLDLGKIDSTSFGLQIPRNVNLAEIQQKDGKLVLKIEGSNEMVNAQISLTPEGKLKVDVNPNLNFAKKYTLALNTTTNTIELKLKQTG